MRLDAPTLMAVTVFVSAVVGFLFLLSWSQARGERALAIWGVAHLVGALAAGLSSLRGHIPDVAAIGAGNALLLLAYALVWTGSRRFEGRPAHRPILLAGPLLWVAAYAVPAFAEDIGARVVLASTLAGLYCALGAREHWRRVTGTLASRGAAVALLATYAAAYLARVPLALLAPLPPGADPLASAWVPILCFASLLYLVALAFVFMALTKERTEGEQRLAADTDSLTGVASRRALASAAPGLMGAERPGALILFDLDHFKRVNDTYGHAAGDAVLAGFAAGAQLLVPHGAVFGRLGGEEFACLAPDLDLAGARRLAELVRGSVAATVLPSLPGLRSSVSVGVAIGAEFETMLARADAALYRAKRAGRNRVEADVGQMAEPLATEPLAA